MAITNSNVHLLTYAIGLFLCFACNKNKSGNNPVIIPPENNIPLKTINTKILIGATVVDAQQNARYASIIETEFNGGQALWYAGFGGWSGPFSYGYDGPNASINWMKTKGISPHIHMLVGPNFYMPDWLKNNPRINAELDTLLKKAIYTIIDTSDNKNKVAIWNVANELFNDDGSYRTDMLWNQLGSEPDQSGLVGVEKINSQHPVFIRKAFQYCRDRTDKKLEYRDFNIENNDDGSQVHKKHKAVYQLLKHMLRSGIPVDAVGIQGHYDIGNLNWILENDGLKKAIQHFKSLGVDVYITELDIGTGSRSWNNILAEQQKKDYYNVVKQAVEAGVSRIYTWGVFDGADRGWRTNEHPLLWDENLNKKPAYYGVQQALIDTK
jgi:GH35 family endo-1,4-beta-xylanase